MKIYHYDQHTGELVGTGFAALSPLDLKQGREVYMIPANATDIEPPQTIEGKTISFVNGAWEYYDIPTPVEAPEPTDAELLQMQINETKRELSRLDNARDAEDLFNVLKSKGILTDADMPATTIARFNQKKALRQQLQQLGG